MTENESVENSTTEEEDRSEPPENGEDGSTEFPEDKEGNLEFSEEERLHEKIEAIEEERDELEEKYLRKVADLDNLRKRNNEEKKKLRKYAHKDVLDDLLEVIDNLNRALDSMEFESEDVADGIDMIRRQLMELLEKHNAEPMEVEGETFDPNLHDAMMQEKKENLNEKKVLDVFKEGYMLHDRVLRPAQVKVGVPADQSNDSESSDGDEDEAN